jgi:ABC-2 type transport system permease protein
MSTTTTFPPAIAVADPGHRVSSSRIFLLETRNELLKMLRMPAYLLPTVLFPVIFYLIFGIVLAKGNQKTATYLLATYGTFGLMGATFFGLGIGLAIERGQGWLLLKRATPMRPMLHFAARIVVTSAIGGTVILLLFAAAAATSVDLPAATWIALFGALLVGALPFAALGLAAGHWLGPNSAPAVLNVIYLPLSFLSGLWMPINMLPGAVQKIAQFLPPYHASQLALATVDLAREKSVWPALLMLLATTALALALARQGSRRDRGATYG